MWIFYPQQDSLGEPNVGVTLVPRTLYVFNVAVHTMKVDMDSSLKNLCLDMY